MVSGDFCEHDWPGTGCPKCRAKRGGANPVDVFREIASVAFPGHTFDERAMAESHAYCEEVVDVVRSEQDPPRRQSTRMWSVTVVYRRADRDIVTQSKTVAADSFWAAVGMVVERAPDSVQELLSLSCVRV